MDTKQRVGHPPTPAPGPREAPGGQPFGKAEVDFKGSKGLRQAAAPIQILADSRTTSCRLRRAIRPGKYRAISIVYPQAKVANDNWLGGKVANLSPAVAEELRLDYSTEGVVVTEVVDGPGGGEAGLSAGKVRERGIIL
jgi:hypothetical protein